MGVKVFFSSDIAHLFTEFSTEYVYSVENNKSVLQASVLKPFTSQPDYSFFSQNFLENHQIWPPAKKNNYILINNINDFNVLIPAGINFQFVQLTELEHLKQHLLALFKIDFIKSTNVNSNKSLLIQLDSSKSETELKEVPEIETETKSLHQKVYVLEEQLQSIQNFYNTEKNRKNFETSLFNFLDFINLLDQSENAFEQLFSYLWKESNKLEPLLMLVAGVCFNNQKVLFLFNGSKLQILNFSKAVESEEHLTTELANLLQRPVKKMQMFINDQQVSSYLAFEKVHTSGLLTKLDDFIKNRLQIVLYSLEKWLIQRTAEKELKKWNNLMRAVPFKVHVVDTHYNILFANYSFKKNQKCFEVLANKKNTCEGCRKNTFKVDFSNNRYQAHFAEINFSFTTSTEPNYFVKYVDLTHSEHVKSELIQAEKMNVIGQLANHLSHELNNPLTGLKMMTELILDSANMGADKSLEKNTDKLIDESIKNDFKEILKGVTRSQMIISDLMSFNQPYDTQNFQLEILNLQEVIRKTQSLLKSVTRIHNLFVDVKPIQVLGKSSLLQQVIFNLVKNACQAMVDKGSVKIYSVISDFIDLYIEDSGPGLPEVVAQNLFKPFTTTKQQSEGTGLGLYISKNIVEKMNAELLFDNTFKSGTRFIIRFKK